jgi:hypothetical protein
MRQIQIFLCAVMMLISTAGYSQGGAPEEQRITELIKSLALLTDAADGCGEQMNYYGKKALQGELCTRFKNSFYAQWPNRDALQEEVISYTDSLDSGVFKCDNCRVVLQRVEELRITVTYYLDYMEFLGEL